MTNRIPLLLAAALLAPAAPAAAAAPYSAIVLDTGDGVTIADAAGGWTVAATTDAGAITVTATREGEPARSVTLRPPAGTVFAPGGYSTLPEPDETNAAVSSTLPWPCTSPTGSLDVNDVEYGAPGTLARLSASFTFTCLADSPVHGEVRYAAADPYRAALAGGSGDFGKLATGTEAVRTVTVTAAGAPVTFGAAAVTGSPSFAVARDTCGGTTRDPGESCEVEVRLTAATGSQSGELRVPANTRRGTAVLALSGTGVAPPDVPGGFAAIPGSDGVALVWSVPSSLPEPVTVRVVRDGATLAEGVASYPGLYYDRPLPQGATHTYSLVAVSGYGESAPTEALTVTTPSGSPEPGTNRAITLEYDGDHFDVPYYMRADQAETGSSVSGSGAGPGSVSLYRNGGFASASFAGPTGGPLVPGEHAVPGGAGVGLNCPSGTEGTLTVHESSLRADGTPDVFSATYDGSCGPGRVRVEARWNSSRDHDALVVSPNKHDTAWNHVRIGQSAPPVSFTVRNGGSRPRTLAAATTGGPAAADWTFDSTGCTAGPLAPGDSCVLTGTFAPKATGERRASLLVGGREIGLLTHGVSAPGTPVVSALPTIGRLRLSWPAVDPGGSAIRYYMVLRGNSFLATTTNLFYDVRLDTLPRSSPLTFRVKAFSYNGEGLPSAPVTVPWPDRQLMFVDPDVIALGLPANPTQRILGSQKGVVEPAVSPDGSQYAYVVRTPTGDHLWAGRTDLYGAPRALTSGATEDRQPAWSPDGTMLAFTRDDASGFGVRIRWMAGTEKVHGVAGGASSPTWLPSGRELVVVRHGTTPYLEVVDLFGTRRKIPGTEGAVQSAVSPDGTRIAFVRFGSGESTTIRVVPVGGGTPVTVASLGGFAQNPTWSPDGRQVYFDSAPIVGADAVGNADLYVTDPVAGGPRNLTGTPDRNETHPVLAMANPPARASQPRLAADFTGDGRAEPAVFRQSDGTWYIRGLPVVRWGQRGDVPVPGDYNGDRRADIAVYRPSNGAWYVRGVGTFSYGQPGDIPAPADYNGDRRTDIAVFRPSFGTWYVRTGGLAWRYGQSGDIPVPADYTGDGRADVAVYRPSTGQWYVRNVGTLVYGHLGAVPAPADYDGDRKTDIAVFDPYDGSWVFLGRPSVTFGGIADVPIPGDFTGDRRAEVAVFRPATGTWYVRGVATLTYGRRGDEPV